MGIKKGDKRVVDHINHNTLDNRKANLRICTNQQNHFNMLKKSLSKTSIYKGVHYVKRVKKFMAYISCPKATYLGYYAKEIDAAMAYDTAAKKYFGEFAKLNVQKTAQKQWKTY
jgi:hypothetical protein